MNHHPFLLFTCLLLLIGQTTSTLAQHSTASRLRIDFSWITASTNSGEYSYDKFPLRNEELEPTPDFSLGLSYRLNPRFRAGISYTSDRYRHRVTFVEPDRIGQTLPDPGRNDDFFVYTHSENWRSVKNHYLSLYLSAAIIDLPQFRLETRLSYENLFFFQRNYDHPMYRGGAIGGELTDHSSYAGGAGLGLDANVRLNPVVSLRLSGTAIQGFGPASQEASQNFRYANLSTGLSFQLGNQAEPPSQSLRKNTIMIGLGLPASFSFERLLYVGKVRHSARLFLDQYLWYQTMVGGAYNLKFGQDKHFFLTEVLFFVPEHLHVGGLIGYEYRGTNGFVFRLDGGLTSNQMGIGPQGNLFPRAQIHFGYAF